MKISTELAESVRFTKIAKNTPYAELFGVFDCNDELTFRLTLPRRLGAYDPILLFDRDDDGERIVCPLEWKESDYVSERYECTVPTLSLCPKETSDALLWYTVLIPCGEEELRLSYNPSGYAPILQPSGNGYQSFQLTVCRAGYDAPHMIRGGIMYHIFVDRFAKGGDVPIREDALLNPDWDNGVPELAQYRGGFVRNNTFFGGTLYGILEKLDYLQSLGVTILYLSPIFRAYSNHKYDTGDYFAVDEMFGGDDALNELLTETRKRGIFVILDGVFNHTGADSRYFNKNGRYPDLGAYQSPESPYFDWYDFTDYPNSYRCWWNINILPAVNTRNADYQQFICGKDGVVAHYLQKGITGWRLDVADELDSEFLKCLRRTAKEVFSDAMIYGEVWEDASNKIAYGKRRRYFRGEELDSVMNYPLRNGIIQFVRFGDWNALFAASAGLYAHYPKGTSDTLMNHLGTHDTERILTVLGGDPEGERSALELSKVQMSPEQYRHGVELLKLCYVLSATLPGIPSIYYGDEAGMEGYRDPLNRMPYPWGRQDADLLSFYRTVGKIRLAEDVFAEGYFRVDETTPKDVFAYLRWNDRKEVYVVVNRGENAYSFSYFGTDLLTGQSGDMFTVLPRSFGIFRKMK